MSSHHRDRARADEEEDASLNELGQALRAQEDAMAADLEGDPFGPLSDEEQSALTASVLSRLGVAQAQPARSVAHAQVPRLSRPARRAWPIVATAFSVAAAALLVFWPRSPEGALPSYGLVLPSPDASHRDGDNRSIPAAHELPRYVLGRELEVLLRPATRVDGGVAARAFVEGQAGALEPLAVNASSAPSGSVTFRVPTGAGTMLAKPASIRLHFVVTAADQSAGDVRSVPAIPSYAQHLVFPLRLIAPSAAPEIVKP